MTLERKLKIALDESRLLILGAQVLFGFQFNGIFQELFDELPRLSRAARRRRPDPAQGDDRPSRRAVHAASHRRTRAGQPACACNRDHFGGVGAAAAVSIALAFDVFIAMDRIAGTAWGVGSGMAEVPSSGRTARARRLRVAPDRGCRGRPQRAPQPDEGAAGYAFGAAVSRA